MLECLALFGQGTVNALWVNVPVELRVRGTSGLPVEQLSDEFVGDILRQRIFQHPTFPKSLQELVDGGFAISGGFSDFSAAHPVGEVKNQHSLVVHFLNLLQ